MNSEWKRYKRTAIAEMRRYLPGDRHMGEPISVSDVDMPIVEAIDELYIPPSGFVARNPANHNDQWYVAQEYAEANFDLENPVEGE